MEENTLKTSIIAGLILLVCLFASGCGKNESKFTGKWVGQTGSFEFMKDNTGVINPPDGVALPRDVRFKWGLQGSDMVRIDVGPPVGKTFFGKLINKDSLVIEEDKFVRQR
jgi:hypothetical protein